MASKDDRTKGDATRKETRDREHAVQQMQKLRHDRVHETLEELVDTAGIARPFRNEEHRGSTRAADEDEDAEGGPRRKAHRPAAVPVAEDVPPEEGGGAGAVGPVPAEQLRF